MIERVTQIVLSLLLVAASMIGTAVPSTQNPSEAETVCTAHIHVAVLYLNSATGIRHVQGVREAWKDHPFSKNACLVSYDYRDTDGGLEMLRELIEKETVDVIIGPTESDVFVRAVGLQEDLGAKAVPVVSGLATASVGNERDGWFFRTNVDAERRVRALYNQFSKYWISTITLLYTDTEFGRRSARAFQEAAQIAGPAGGLTAILVKDPSNCYEQLKRVLDRRPEAVGFLAEREDIEHMYNELRSMNTSPIPYRPMVFSILDARQIARGVRDIFFVSLTEGELTLKINGRLLEGLDGQVAPHVFEALKQVEGQAFPGKASLVESLGGEAGVSAADLSRILAHVDVSDSEDDVTSLGYDTASLVLGQLQKLGKRDLDRNDRRALRDNLVTLMTRSGELEGSKTSLTFSELSNVTIPGVFHLKDMDIERIPSAQHVGMLMKLLHKTELVFSIYGWWIWVCLAVALIIAVLVSRMDLRRQFPQKHVKIYRTKVIYLYSLGHFLAVVTLYIFLAETGRIAYHDLLMVVIISLTPSALLRTTFFETRHGRLIGMEGIYRRLMETLDRQIMRARYGRLEALRNSIAYSNAEDTIRGALTRIYRNHPSSVQSARLIQQMEERMANEPSYLDRRRIGAELLLRELDVEQLKAEGLLPPGWDPERAIDPKIMIRKAAKRCAYDREKRRKIEERLDKEMNDLKDRNPNRHRELDAFKRKELDQVVATEGDLVVKLRILLVLVGLDLNWFKEEGFLSEEDIKEECDRLEDERRGRLRRFFRSFWPGQVPGTTTGTGAT